MAARVVEVLADPDEVLALRTQAEAQARDLSCFPAAEKRRYRDHTSYNCQFISFYFYQIQTVYW